MFAQIFAECSQFVCLNIPRMFAECSPDTKTEYSSNHESMAILSWSNCKNVQGIFCEHSAVWTFGNIQELSECSQNIPWIFFDEYSVPVYQENTQRTFREYSNRRAPYTQRIFARTFPKHSLNSFLLPGIGQKESWYAGCASLSIRDSRSDEATRRCVPNPRWDTLSLCWLKNTEVPGCPWTNTNMVKSKALGDSFSLAETPAEPCIRSNYHSPVYTCVHFFAFRR